MLLEDNEVIIILCVMIILFLVLVMINLVNRTYADDYPDNSEYIDSTEMNNGDLVCVSYNNVAGAFVTSFSKSIWSHTGTIWVNPKTQVRYVMEGSIYKTKKYQHFIMVPLETWLFFNKKSLLAYKKYHGKPIDSNFMYSIFKPFNIECKLEAMNVLWSRFLFERDHYEYAKNDRYTCIEFTVILGQELNIFKKDKIYCSYFPDHVVNNKIPFCEGVSYAAPIKIRIQLTDLVLLRDDIQIHSKFWKN